MNRRTLLKSAGATALIPSIGVIRAKPMRASSVEMGWASYFGGNTRLVGTPKRVPPSSPYVVAAFSYRSSNTGQQYFFTSGLSPSDPNFQFIITSNAPGSIGAYFNQPGNPFGTAFDNVVNTSESGYITVVIALDATIPKLEMWATGLSNISTVSYSPAFTVNFGSAPAFTVSGFVNNGQLMAPFIGDMSYFYLLVGTKCNLTDIIDGFYNFESGYSNRLTADGRSAIPGVSPQVLLSGPPGPPTGPPTGFAQNRAAGSWMFPWNLSRHFSAKRIYCHWQRLTELRISRPIRTGITNVKEEST